MSGSKMERSVPTSSLIKQAREEIRAVLARLVPFQSCLTIGGVITLGLDGAQEIYVKLNEQIGTGGRDISVETCPTHHLMTKTEPEEPPEQTLTNGESRMSSTPSRDSGVELDMQNHATSGGDSLANDNQSTTSVASPTKGHTVLRITRTDTHYGSELRSSTSEDERPAQLNPSDCPPYRADSPIKRSNSVESPHRQRNLFESVSPEKTLPKQVSPGEPSIVAPEHSPEAVGRRRRRSAVNYSELSIGNMSERQMLNAALRMSETAVPASSPATEELGEKELSEHETSGNVGNEEVGKGKRAGKKRKKGRAGGTPKKKKSAEVVSAPREDATDTEQNPSRKVVCTEGPSVRKRLIGQIVPIPDGTLPTDSLNLKKSPSTEGPKEVCSSSKASAISGSPSDTSAETTPEADQNAANTPDTDKQSPVSRKRGRKKGRRRVTKSPKDSSPASDIRPEKQSKRLSGGDAMSSEVERSAKSKEQDSVPQNEQASAEVSPVQSPLSEESGAEPSASKKKSGRGRKKGVKPTKPPPQLSSDEMKKLVNVLRGIETTVSPHLYLDDKQIDKTRPKKAKSTHNVTTPRKMSGDGACESDTPQKRVEMRRASEGSVPQQDPLMVSTTESSSSAAPILSPVRPITCNTQQHISPTPPLLHRQSISPNEESDDVVFIGEKPGTYNSITHRVHSTESQGVNLDTHSGVITIAPMEQTTPLSDTHTQGMAATQAAPMDVVAPLPRRHPTLPAPASAGVPVVHNITPLPQPRPPRVNMQSPPARGRPPWSPENIVSSGSRELPNAWSRHPARRYSSDREKAITVPETARRVVPHEGPGPDVARRVMPHEGHVHDGELPTYYSRYGRHLPSTSRHTYPAPLIYPVPDGSPDTVNVHPPYMEPRQLDISLSVTAQQSQSRSRDGGHGPVLYGTPQQGALPNPGRQASIREVLMSPISNVPNLPMLQQTVTPRGMVVPSVRHPSSHLALTSSHNAGLSALSPVVSRPLQPVVASSQQIHSSTTSAAAYPESSVVTVTTSQLGLAPRISVSVSGGSRTFSPILTNVTSPPGRTSSAPSSVPVSHSDIHPQRASMTSSASTNIPGIQPGNIPLSVQDAGEHMSTQNSGQPAPHISQLQASTGLPAQANSQSSLRSTQAVSGAIISSRSSQLEVRAAESSRQAPAQTDPVLNHDSSNTPSSSAPVSTPLPISAASQSHAVPSNPLLGGGPHVGSFAHLSSNETTAAAPSTASQEITPERPTSAGQLSTSNVQGSQTSNLQIPAITPTTGMQAPPTSVQAPPASVQAPPSDIQGPPCTLTTIETQTTASMPRATTSAEQGSQTSSLHDPPIILPRSMQDPPTNIQGPANSVIGPLPDIQTQTTNSMPCATVSTEQGSQTSSLQDPAITQPTNIQNPPRSTQDMQTNIPIQTTSSMPSATAQQPPTVPSPQPTSQAPSMSGSSAVTLTSLTSLPELSVPTSSSSPSDVTKNVPVSSSAIPLTNISNPISTVAAMPSGSTQITTEAGNKLPTTNQNIPTSKTGELPSDVSLLTIGTPGQNSTQSSTSLSTSATSVDTSNLQKNNNVEGSAASTSGQNTPQTYSSTSKDASLESEFRSGLSFLQELMDAHINTNDFSVLGLTEPCIPLASNQPTPPTPNQQSNGVQPINQPAVVGEFQNPTQQSSGAMPNMSRHLNVGQQNPDFQGSGSGMQDMSQLNAGTTMQQQQQGPQIFSGGREGSGNNHGNIHNQGSQFSSSLNQSQGPQNFNNMGPSGIQTLGGYNQDNSGSSVPHLGVQGSGSSMQPTSHDGTNSAMQMQGNNFQNSSLPYACGNPGGNASNVLQSPVSMNSGSMQNSSMNILAPGMQSPGGYQQGIGHQNQLPQNMGAQDSGGIAQTTGVYNINSAGQNQNMQHAEMMQNQPMTSDPTSQNQPMMQNQPMSSGPTSQNQPMMQNQPMPSGPTNQNPPMMQNQPMLSGPTSQNQPMMQNQLISSGPTSQNQPMMQNQPISSGPTSQNQSVIQNQPMSSGPTSQNQPMMQNQPMSSGPISQNQPVMQNQPMSSGPTSQNQPMMQNRPISSGPTSQNQPGMQHQPISSSPSSQNQPMMQNQPMSSGPSSQNQPMMQNQPMSSAPSSQNQPMMQNQPMSSGPTSQNQPMMQNQPMSSAPTSQNQPVMQNQPMSSAPTSQNQPMMQNQPMSSNNMLQNQGVGPGGMTQNQGVGPGGMAQNQGVGPGGMTQNQVVGPGGMTQNQAVRPGGMTQNQGLQHSGTMQSAVMNPGGMGQHQGIPPSGVNQNPQLQNSQNQGMHGLGNVPAMNPGGQQFSQTGMIPGNQQVTSNMLPTGANMNQQFVQSPSNQNMSSPNVMGSSTAMGSTNAMGSPNAMVSQNVMGSPTAMGSTNAMGSPNAMGTQNVMGSPTAMGSPQRFGGQFSGVQGSPQGPGQPRFPANMSPNMYRMMLAASQGGRGRGRGNVLSQQQMTALMQQMQRQRIRQSTPRGRSPRHMSTKQTPPRQGLSHRPRNNDCVIVESGSKTPRRQVQHTTNSPQTPSSSGSGRRRRNQIAECVVIDDDDDEPQHHRRKLFTPQKERTPSPDCIIVGDDKSPSNDGPATRETDRWVHESQSSINYGSAN